MLGGLFRTIEQCLNTMMDCFIENRLGNDTEHNNI
jgi:hypothetical protein